MFTLVQAVHKMTGLTARNFRLQGRSHLSAGACADVVVFDPARIADTANYDHPISTSVGVVAVYVNGVQAYAEGGPVLACQGHMLSRGLA